MTRGPTFELGPDKIVRTIEIRWPSGVRQRLENVKDQFLKVDKPPEAVPGAKVP
jgi:ASPIC and UnbV